MDRLLVQPLEGRLPDHLAVKPGPELRLYWLGQAGFVIDCAGRRIVIDPYLSDSLAEKYRGTAFPHLRMMPPPIAPDELRHVDLVLVTHHHNDHMDPGTLPTLTAGNPGARLVVPRASLETARQRGRVEDARLISIDAGETIEPLSDVAVTATRAAHETLEQDENGHHRFLGYAVRLGGRVLFHSGDTIPFDGLVEDVRCLDADVALLPVNGRDEHRSGNGIPGNLGLEEAVDLARKAGIATMIAHHYGLFDFNTINPETIDDLAASIGAPQLLRAETGVVYWPTDG